MVVPFVLLLAKSGECADKMQKRQSRSVESSLGKEHRAAEKWIQKEAFAQTVDGKKRGSAGKQMMYVTFE